MKALATDIAGALRECAAGKSESSSSEEKGEGPLTGLPLTMRILQLAFDILDICGAADGGAMMTTMGSMS